MISHPLVSVIIPVFNSEAFVAEAIESVRAQSYPKWELILVDDGSTDRSKNIIQPFLKDHRIRYVFQKNKGQGSARNTGIGYASGSLVAFLDADDIWDAHKLETQVKIMQTAQPDLVYSKIRYISSRGVKLHKKIGSGTGIIHGFRGLFMLGCGNIAIPNSSVIVKKESVLKVGGLSESKQNRNIEDYDLWFRLLLGGCLLYGLPEVLGSYRRHENQVTFYDRGQNLKFINYLEMLCERYPEKKRFFKFIILQRLSAFYMHHINKEKAKEICLNKFYESRCLNTYWFERYLIKVVEFENYLKFRGLILRRFRRYQHFLALLNE